MNYRYSLRGIALAALFILSAMAQASEAVRPKIGLVLGGGGARVLGGGSAGLQRQRDEPELAEALVPARAEVEHVQADQEREQRQHAGAGRREHVGDQIVIAVAGALRDPLHAVPDPVPRPWRAVALLVWHAAKSGMQYHADLSK